VDGDPSGLGGTTGLNVTTAVLTLNATGAPVANAPGSPNGGALENVSGLNTWATPITLQTVSGTGQTDAIGVDAGTTLTISGTVQDPNPAVVPVANLAKVGAGTLVFPNANSYTGATLVNQGILNIQNAGALGGSVSEQQTITLSGPQTGTFSLQFTNPNTGVTSTVSGLSASPTTTTASVLQADLTNAATFPAIGPGNVSVALSGSTYTLTFTGSLAGQFLAPIVATGANGTTGAVAITVDGSQGTTVTTTPEVQQVTVTGGSGTFSLGFNGQSTPSSGQKALAFNATAGAVQTALNALSTIGGVGGSVTVTSPSTGTYIITFGGSLTGLDQLQMTAAGSGGAAASVTTLTNGISGTLQIQGGITVSSEPLTLTGPGYTGIGALDSPAGANTWDSPITLAGNASIAADTDQTQSPAVPSTLTVDQPISESATGSNLTKAGTGIVVFTGANNNTYSGVTSVSDGTLQLNKPAGFTAIAGDLTAGDGTSPGPDLVQLLASNQLASTSNLTVNSDGVFDLNGQTQAIAKLTMTGGNIKLTGGASQLTLGSTVTATSDTSGNVAVISGPGTLSMGNGNITFKVNPGGGTPDMIVSSVITGSGGALTKDGAGTLQLTNTETYSGGTTVKAGTLLVDGSQGQIGAVLGGRHLGRHRHRGQYQ
jgi:autotransporter-associated beta strand protein